MRLVIDTPGLYRVYVEPGQQPIIYGYEMAEPSIAISTVSGKTAAVPYCIPPDRFLQDGPSDTPTA